MKNIDLNIKNSNFVNCVRVTSMLIFYEIKLEQYSINLINVTIVNGKEAMTKLNWKSKSRGIGCIERSKNIKTQKATLCIQGCYFENIKTDLQRTGNFQITNSYLNRSFFTVAASNEFFFCL